MTGTQIISSFNLYVDDSAELSSSESLNLLNKWYHKVLNNRPWEFLKKTYTATLTSDDYISLPSDFGYIIENDLTNRPVLGDNEPQVVVFVGTSYEPWVVIPFSERRDYRDNSGYCWVDVRQDRLYFSQNPGAGLSVEFDYIYVPDNLTLATSPVFPARFHEVLYHGMASDQFVIEQSEKALSYRDENIGLYESYLADMGDWDSRFKYYG